MRAARVALGAGLFVLSLLLAGPVWATADSLKEEVKRLIEAERIKKLVEDAQTEARRLAATNPNKSLEVLRSALGVLESDQSLPPEQRQALLRRLRRFASEFEPDVPKGKLHAVQEKDTDARIGDFQKLLEIDRAKLYAEHAAMAEAVQRATKVVLYEGLPHQVLDGALIKVEQKTKKTLEIHKYLFYQETLTLNTEDAQKLKETLCNPRSISFPGLLEMNTCVFHPDYCVEWHDGKDVYQVQICFGCHEASLYGPKTALHCDVRTEAYTQIKTILKPYRKNRPNENDWSVLLAASKEANTRGWYLEAEVYATVALQQVRKSGAGEQAIVACLIQQAEVALRQGQFGKTNESAGRAQLLLEKLHGPEHPDVALCLELRADAYLSVGLPSVAFTLARQSGIIRKKAFGNKHLDFARALETLARIHEIQGRNGYQPPNEDEEWKVQAGKRALAIRRALVGEDHPDLIPALLTNELHQQAEVLIKKHYGEKHPLLAECLRQQAWDQFSRDNHEAADKLLQRSLEMSKKTVGRNHPSTYPTLELLAEVSKHQSNVQRTESLLLDSIHCRFRGLSDEELCWFFRIAAELRHTFNTLHDEPLIYESYLTEMIARGGDTIEACLQRHYDELSSRHGRGVLYNHFRTFLEMLPFKSLQHLPAADERFESMEVLTALRRVQGRPDPVQIVVRGPLVRECFIDDLPDFDLALRNVDSLGQPSGFTDGGNYRSGRLTRWRFQVENSRGEILPVLLHTHGMEGGLFRLTSLRRGEEWEAKLPMGDYVAIPGPGEYVVRILYHDTRTLMSHTVLAGLITCQSPVIRLKVRPLFEVSEKELNQVKSLLNSTDASKPVKVVAGAYGPWAHKFLDPDSPAGQILTLGWRAVPVLLEELERKDTPVKQRAWILALLFRITGANGPRPSAGDVLGKHDWYDRPWVASGNRPGEPPSEGSGWTKPGSAKGTINPEKQKAFARRWQDWKKSLIIRAPAEESR